MSGAGIVASGVLALVAVPAGIALGLGYFTALRRSVHALAAAGVGLNVALATLARIAVAVAAFAVCAHLGGAVLVGAFAGFLIARAICVQRVRATL